VTTSISLPSKAGLKSSKHGPNDRGANLGKATSQVYVYGSMLLVIMESNFCFLTVMYLYQRGLPARASVSMISTQDPAQSQALFNIKDSNKVSYHLVPQYLLFVFRLI
jgi:cytoskeleton-associated protein 5